MVLNPSSYLTSQGWEGPGKGFTASARAKPIVILQKKNNFGVGKDRDTAYPWWDDVFSNVLSKIGKTGVKQDGQRSSESGLARTTTGIISPLPPVGPSINLTSRPITNLNMDAMDCAKRNAAHRDLYRRFCRGRTIEGTVEDSPPIMDQPSLCATPFLEPDFQQVKKEIVNDKKSSEIVAVSEPAHPSEAVACMTKRDKKEKRKNRELVESQTETARSHRTSDDHKKRYSDKIKKSKASEDGEHSKALKVKPTDTSDKKKKRRRNAESPDSSVSHHLKLPDKHQNATVTGAEEEAPGKNHDSSCKKKERKQR